MAITVGQLRRADFTEPTKVNSITGESKTFTYLNIDANGYGYSGFDEGVYKIKYTENNTNKVEVYLLDSKSMKSQILALNAIKNFNSGEEKEISIPSGYDTVLFMYSIGYIMQNTKDSGPPNPPVLDSFDAWKYQSVNKNLTYSDIGVRGAPGAKFFLNNEIFQLGKSGTFELHEDNIKITSVGVIDADKITAIDYRAET